MPEQEVHQPSNSALTKQQCTNQAITAYKHTTPTTRLRLWKSFFIRNTLYI
ncbi:hypothetical protein HMPREF0673_00040 [Leyella stercorea DSM 18206]|uniref:Uncharacterized protein n=1 Tax=Leyella stercorea DSM 18206 TaxID=1002367 RepID=G6ATV6_9BACT|nr:hypothetical protein HMPREF0673_00040 [Leyella stercorea DSM 18206]